LAEVFNTINERTMVRKFTDKAISEKEKRAIIEAGIRAPTAGGNEQWEFRLIETPKLKEDLRGLLIDAQKAYFTRMLYEPWTEEAVKNWFGKMGDDIYKAPFYVAVLVDLRERAYTIPDVEELWAQQSAAAAIENMFLAAWALGIGGCWFGVPLLMEKEFRALLGLEEGLKIAAILAFGYPKENPTPKARKKRYEDVVKQL